MILRSAAVSSTSFLAMILLISPSLLPCVLCEFGAGLGTSLIYLPSIVIVSVYFERRRALATGMAVCGTGVGTIVFAPLVECLLEVYGWRGTLLIEAGLLLNCCVCAAFYLPPSAVTPTPPSSAELLDTVWHLSSYAAVPRAWS